MAERRFRRPAMLDMEEAEQIEGDIDPADRALIAHETAAAMVSQARASQDPQLVDRLVHLVDEEGIDTIAMLWSKAEPHTLPGSLWRLYMIREWVKHDGETVARSYHRGVHAAHVRHAIAGVEDPPGPEEVQRLADAILSGVYAGDLAVALERAGAFCRVVATGAAFEAESDEGHADARAHRTTLRAAQLLRTGEDLELNARMWREERLD
ncbi:hypothetical protein [Demequina capsici]|uniref:DNA-directed RNA polymerase subunit beta n=1 Tax=Demequina capsici TaxID=3075620 RepID=A0AA96F6N9_9MICO|nr:hypothetical protein [Demequina sp. OYTSA14]WNM24813.1 hypothetical protein RN606_01295 [Demequina sp. OYTSA14]